MAAVVTSAADSRVVQLAVTFLFEGGDLTVRATVRKGLFGPDVSLVPFRTAYSDGPWTFVRNSSISVPPNPP
jgi:hypothetical protein